MIKRKILDLYKYINRKKIIIIFIAVFLLSIFITNPCLAKDEQEKVEINFFYSETCPHCAQMREFLSNLEKQYPEMEIKKFNIFERDSIELLKKLYQKYNVPQEKKGLVPVIFTPERYFIGFSKAITEEIEGCIENCIADKEGAWEQIQNKISVFFIGEIDVSKYSLPALAVLLGFFDGFNVCSLGALVLILGLVLVLRSRKKILIFGGVFIVTTAIIYGLLIVLWYQIFALFASYLRVMEILIGLLGIAGGIYFLKEFIRYKKQGPTCELQTGKGIISRFSSKIQKILQGGESKRGESIIVLILSILLFTALITIVEFPCSAAVPVFFASLLAKAQLPIFYYLLYIVIYLLFYMLDEIIVFLIAFFTMTIKLASVRFITWISLVEAIILFLLGLYYLFGFLIFI